MAKRMGPPLAQPTKGAGGKTGDWRSSRPVVNHEKCSQCLLCYVYCSEGVIDKNQQIDLEYCKGCGVCETECPKGAITMEKEDAQ